MIFYENFGIITNKKNTRGLNLNMTDQKRQKITDNWIWKLYFFVYLGVVTFNAKYFFSSESPLYLYHHILIGYDILFLVAYCYNALSIVLNILSLVPFYLFIYKKNFLTLHFWRCVFIFKIIFDFAGRPYETLFFRSLFYQSTKVALNALGLFILLHIPAYIAFVLYAFKKEYYPES